MMKRMVARSYSELISDPNIKEDIVTIFLSILTLEVLFRISFANVDETAIAAFLFIFGLLERNVSV